jgi:hypothetical protein
MSSSNVFTVTVIPPPTTQLGTIAAAMPSGTWVALDGGVHNGVACPLPTDYLTYLARGGNTQSILPYANRCDWNPVSKNVEILGRDHSDPSAPDGTGFGYIHHVRLRTADHSMVDANGAWPYPPAPEGPAGHNFGHQALDPNTGDLYFVNYGSLSVGSYPVLKLPHGTTTWQTVAPSPEIYENIIWGVCWWSGEFTGQGGLGAHGGLLVFNYYLSADSPDDGNLGIYDPLSDSWPFFLPNGASPFTATGSQYNQCAAYSRVKNCAVYGGGHAAQHRLWKLASDGTVATLTDMPSSAKGIGIHYGLLSADPVTGNFLVLTSDAATDTTPELWELDPDGAGTWTRMTGARQPPAAVGFPSEDNSSAFCIICAPIDEAGYDVTAYIRQSGGGPGGSAMHLYKHA